MEFAKAERNKSVSMLKQAELQEQLDLRLFESLKAKLAYTELL
jgi:hypothetical protein